MFSYQFGGEPPEYEGIAKALFNLYRLRTAQCLILGDIAKCLPWTLETLIYHSTAEQSRDDDKSRGQWMMASLLVRAAINMGYHREPPKTSPISVLQAELRRRVWLCVANTDRKASFMAGLPSMMSAVESDTLAPRNLHDWELSDGMAALPPSRPLTDFTPVTYLIVKGRVVNALGAITDFNNALSHRSYDKVVELDRLLHEAYINIPPCMKKVRLQVSQADTHIPCFFLTTPASRYSLTQDETLLSPAKPRLTHEN